MQSLLIVRYHHA